MDIGLYNNWLQFIWVETTHMIIYRYVIVLRRFVPAVQLDGQHFEDMGRSALRPIRALRQAHVGTPT